MFDDVVRVYVPPGWPASVLPPGAPGWLESATAFLFDCCPPDYRRHQVLRRHPVVLARLACRAVAGQLEATRRGLAGLRVELGEYVDGNTMALAAGALQEEEARLARTLRAADLVEQGLREGGFVPRL